MTLKMSPPALCESPPRQEEGQHCVCVGVCVVTVRECEHDCVAVIVKLQDGARKAAGLHETAGSVQR